MFDSEYKSDLFYHQCQQWLNKVLENQQKIYHYTSVDVLKNIIEGKCMYATHINFMNDWEEYVIGYRILTSMIKEAIEKYRGDFESVIGKEELDRILNNFSDECLNVTNYSLVNKDESLREFREVTLPEVYTISFCKEKDLLSQWIIYAKESGVAVEFDFTDFILCDASLEGEEQYNEDTWQSIKYYRNNKPHMINYTSTALSNKLEEQIIEVIRMIKKPTFASCDEINRPLKLFRKMAELYNIVPYCKTDDFKAESEIRLAFMRLEDWVEKKGKDYGEIHKTKVFYRTANQVLKPYIKIGWEAQKSNIYPIKRIIVGPGENQEAVFRGIIHFIENQDNDTIPSEKGKIPFSEPMITESYLTCKGIIIEKSKIPYIYK